MKGKNKPKHDKKKSPSLCKCGNSKAKGKSYCKDCKKNTKGIKVSILMGNPIPPKE